MSYKKNFTRSYPYQIKGRFFNHSKEKREPFLFRSIAMYVESFRKRLFGEKPDISNWYKPAQIPEYSIPPLISWIGHATFLIQIGGLNIVTDPIFGNQSILFPRQLPPGITLKKLIPIDYILISHNHHDHMHAPSLLQLKPSNSCILVPKGIRRWFDVRGFSLVKENMWWESKIALARDEERKKITFTFLPTHHWSGRGLFDYNKSLWGSWLIEYDGYRIYFGGDTAYSPYFAEIGREYNAINMALMPIGPCEPRKWMKHSHMDANEAVQAFLDLKAEHFIPMHWGTFAFGTDDFLKPIEQLKTCWQQNKGLKEKELTILKVGQSIYCTQKV